MRQQRTTTSRSLVAKPDVGARVNIVVVVGVIVLVILCPEIAAMFVCACLAQVTHITMKRVCCVVRQRTCAGTGWKVQLVGGCRMGWLWIEIRMLKRLVRWGFTVRLQPPPRVCLVFAIMLSRTNTTAQYYHHHHQSTVTTITAPRRR